MTFRQSVLALAAPVLSIALVGCQPPLEEKKEGGAMAPSTSGAMSTPSPTPTPAPTDAKPTDAMPAPAPTPSAEAPKDVTPAPTEPKKEEMPKS